MLYRTNYERIRLGLALKATGSHNFGPVTGSDVDAGTMALVAQELPPGLQDPTWPNMPTVAAVPIIEPEPEGPVVEPEPVSAGTGKRRSAATATGESRGAGTARAPGASR